MSNFSQPITAPSGQQFILRSDNERFLIDFITAYNRLSDRAKRLIAVGISNKYPIGTVVFTTERGAINGTYRGDGYATYTIQGFFISDGRETVIRDVVAWLCWFSFTERARTEIQEKILIENTDYTEALEPELDEDSDIMAYLVDDDLSDDWIDRIRQVRDALRDEAEFLSRILDEVTA